MVKGGQMTDHWSWRLKLQEEGDEVAVRVLDGHGEGIKKTTRKVVSVNPRVIWVQMTSLGWAEFCSVEELRKRLAARLRGDEICLEKFESSMKIACEASYEDICRGAPIDYVAPFWRVIEPESDFAQGLLCGSEWIYEMRRKETAPESVWEKAHRILGFDWPTPEEIGNDPIEMLLDIRISEGLWTCFRDEEGIEFTDFLKWAFIYEGKPWYGVIRNLTFASDFDGNDLPMYEEFEDTKLTGFEFAELIADRIGKPFRRIGPFDYPIRYEVWDFSAEAS